MFIEKLCYIDHQNRFCKSCRREYAWPDCGNNFDFAELIALVVVDSGSGFLMMSLLLTLFLQLLVTLYG